MVQANPGPQSSGLGGFFNRIVEMLDVVAITALTVALIIIGFKVMFAIRSGDNVRAAIQNMGVVAFAALLIGGASGIAALLYNIGQTIAGTSNQ